MSDAVFNDIFGDYFQTPAPAPQQVAAGGNPLRLTVRPQDANPPSMPQTMLTDFQNIGSSAGQMTTPDIASHMPNLISSDVYQNDAGEALFRDQQGAIVPTDNSQHVILRDPADNRLKVFNRMADTNEGRLASGGRLMMTGMGAGAPTARPAMPSTANIVPRASDIFGTAKPYYRLFDKEANSLTLPEGATASIANYLRAALTKARFIPEHANEVYSAIGTLDRAGEQPLTYLQSVKQIIGRSFQSPDSRVREAAGVATSALNKVIGMASPAAAENLRTADQIHSTARAVRDLQQRGSIAALRKGRAGYGGNAVNTMRQTLSPIVEASIKGRQTPYKPDEIAAIRAIVEGNNATNLARGVGMASPSKGSIPTLMSLGASFMSGSPVPLAIPAIGAASNKLATILTGQQIQRLQQLVAKRSPAYAAAVAKAVDRYERAQMEFVNNPSAAKLNSYVTASRALASGLSHDGMRITAGDLLRRLQGPMGSAAQDEQPQP